MGAGIDCHMGKRKYNYNELRTNINIKRTKSIVFNSSGRINTTDFKYDYKPIEKGRSYKYLGINLTDMFLFQITE
jgi:hypothetical protein